MVVAVTGELIKSSIIRKVVASFQPAVVKIYKEPTLENLELPCFFIRTLDVDQTKRGRYYRLDYQMNLRYHIEDQGVNPNSILDGMGFKLLEYLSTISVPIFLGNYDNLGEPIMEDKPVKGTQMSYNIVDGILQLFVTYSIDVLPLPVATTRMEGINLELQINNG